MIQKGHLRQLGKFVSHLRLCSVILNLGAGLSMRGFLGQGYSLLCFKRQNFLYLE